MSSYMAYLDKVTASDRFLGLSSRSQPKIEAFNAQFHPSRPRTISSVLTCDLSLRKHNTSFIATTAPLFSDMSIISATKPTSEYTLLFIVPKAILCVSKIHVPELSLDVPLQFPETRFSK